MQFLARAPELIARYRNAPPYAAAVINAAMDARRLGIGIALPRAFLEAAGAGYLDDADWDALPMTGWNKPWPIRPPHAREPAARWPASAPEPTPTKSPGLLTSWPTTLISTAAASASLRPVSGRRQIASPTPLTCQPSPGRLRTAACSASQPASASAPLGWETAPKPLPLSGHATP